MVRASVEQPYFAQVGPTIHPVKPAFAQKAKALDTNQDYEITQAEIEASLADAPDSLSMDKAAYSQEIRQQLLGLPAVHKDAYLSAEEIDQKLEELAKQHAENAEVVTIGTSLEGRPIKALHVSNDIASPQTSSKPSVIITGNLHAREWVTSGTVTSGAEKLLNGAAPEALENLEVWFVPDANPDGLTHSRDVDPMWRKNTWRDSSGEVKGVDLNRNFPFRYRLAEDSPDSIEDDKGASDDPNSLLYRGNGALTEPESMTIKTLLAQEDDAVGLLDVHSFGRMVLVSKGENEVSSQEYQEIGQAMNQAIKRVDYKVMTEDGLYPTTGGLAGYADSLGMVGITLEVGTSFQPDAKTAKSTEARSSDGVVEFIKQMEKRSR